MRLPLADFWLDGLDDEHFAVRSTALGVVTDEIAPPPVAVERVIARIDRDGWDEAYEFSHQIQDLPHDEASITWLAGRLESLLQASTADEDSPLKFLMAWFLNAPTAFLERELGRVSAALEGHRPPAGKPLRLASVTGPRPASLDPARERLELAAAAAEALMETFEDTIARCASSGDFPAAAVELLDRVCEELGKRGVIPADTLAKWLEVDPEEDPDDREPETDWLAGAAMEILRHGDALLPVDSLIRWLGVDWDWTNERVARTLYQRADESAMRRILEIYPTLDWAGRLYLTDVIDRARFAPLESMVRELARNEPAADLKADLAVALVRYGCAESLELAREIQWRQAGRAEQGELKEVLAVYDWLTGTRSPKVVRQLEELERKARQIRRKMMMLDHMSGMPGETARPDRALSWAEASMPPPDAGIRDEVERNEPCPCGSGRKFKKCCGA
jgi:hypothetical protein